MTTALHDDQAERAVAGIAIGAGWAARAALIRCAVGDFRDLTLGRAVALAADLDDGALPDPGDDVELLDERRGHAIASQLDRPQAWSRQLLDARPNLSDSSGALARRVHEAAARRRDALELLDRLAELGVPVEVTA